jgi:peptide deformylase
VALEVKTFGDPVLKTRAARVKEFDDALLRLTEEMLVTMREREGVGLAANQVGRLRRVLVAGIEEDEYVLINPVIEPAPTRPKFWPKAASRYRASR